MIEDLQRVLPFLGRMSTAPGLFDEKKSSDENRSPGAEEVT
jgi:hypothetical protein